ncbi:MAG: hypothetical protein FWG02_11075 [Holophagaceae bacterium]|nr:hypothetical protein [Holophagaceae bacterium]
MGRIEEFTLEGKKFIYLDMSNFREVDEYNKLIEESIPLITKHSEFSIYTVTNIEGVRFDSEVKKSIAMWMEHNKPYVKYGAVCGVDGVKKIMLNAIFTLSGRMNMHTVTSKQEAIDWLLKQG